MILAHVHLDTAPPDDPVRDRFLAKVEAMRASVAEKETPSA